MVVEEKLAEKLCKENKGFEKLWNNHHDLKEKIQEFERRSYLAPEEELENKRLKKIKLKEKDIMLQMVNEYCSKKAQRAEVG